MENKPSSRDNKDLNRQKYNILKKEAKMERKEISKELKKAFNRLEGCISFDGSGAELAKLIRKNGFIKLRGA